MGVGFCHKGEKKKKKRMCGKKSLVGQKKEGKDFVSIGGTYVKNRPVRKKGKPCREIKRGSIMVKNKVMGRKGGNQETGKFQKGKVGKDLFTYREGGVVFSEKNLWQAEKKMVCLSKQSKRGGGENVWQQRLKMRGESGEKSKRKKGGKQGGALPSGGPVCNGGGERKTLRWPWGGGTKNYECQN